MDGPSLSRREIEVVELASLGMTNTRIAEQLTVSVAASSSIWRRSTASLEWAIGPRRW